MKEYIGRGMQVHKTVRRTTAKAWIILTIIIWGTLALPGQVPDSSSFQQIDSLVVDALEYEYENPGLARKKSIKALQLSLVHHYDQGQRDALSALGKAYLRVVNYDSAQYCLERALRLDSISGRSDNMVVSLANLANLYTRRGQFKAANDYYYRALEIAELQNYDDYTASLYNNIAGRYRDLDRPRKSVEYCWKAIGIWKGMPGQESNLGYTYLNLSTLCYDYPELIPEDDPEAAYTYLDQAEKYFQISEDEFKLNDCKLSRSNFLVEEENGGHTAYLLAKEATDYFEKTGNLMEAAGGHLFIGQSLSALGRYSEALDEIRVARKIGEETGIYDIEQRAMFKESEALMHLGMYEQSNAVLNTAYSFRDSILGHDLKLELSEVQEKYNLSRERADRLEMEGIVKEEKGRAARLKNTAIIVSLVAALLFTFLLLVLRQRQNREKMKMAEFQRNLADEKMQVAALKLQMLGAQMNPHFVKNALSSIQSLLQHNQVNQSNSYIEAFARLQRTLLETASDHTITLDDELQLIQDYVKIEQLRFDQGFDFTLVGIEDLDLEFDRIPSMMLQPIIENAINHGLFHKGAKGHLKITFQRVDAAQVELLKCIIEDDGVGLEFTKRLSIWGRKSRSMDILQKRLAILSNRLNYTFDLQMEELKGVSRNTKGTRARILIPLV